MGMFGNTTVLTQPDEAAFQKWRSALPSDLQNMSDYDLRGAWKSNASAASNGHLPDTWKLPNHMTFSDGSQYSTPQTPGGRWSPVDERANKWLYWASPTNLQYHSIPDMARYFQQVEPNSQVVFPSDYRLTAR